MKNSLAELVAISDIQEILASFHASTGISIEILDENHQGVAASPERTMGGDFDRNISQAEQKWRQGEEEVVVSLNTKQWRRLMLPGGRFKYAGDIRVDHRKIATLILGPVLHASPDEDYLHLVTPESGADVAAYRETAQKVPVVTEQQSVSYLEMLIQFTWRLAEKGLNETHLLKANSTVQEKLEKQEKAARKLEKRIQERTQELESTNAALQESVQRFRLTLMDTPVVVFNQDLDLRYTWIYNPKNYAEQPVVGKRDEDLFASEDAQRLTALKRRVIAAGLLTREEVSVTVGARTSFYDMTLDPLYDENGAVTGLTCAATDVTERKQIEEGMRKRLAESEGIRRIAKGLLQKIGLDEVLEIVCTEAMQLTGAKGSVVLLLDKEGWLRLTHRAGSPVYTMDRLPVEGTLAGRAVQTGSHVWANRQESEADQMADQWEGYPWTPGLLSMLSVPLKVDDQTIGVLNILDKPGELTQEDVRIIDLFADQAAIIIEHVRLQHRAEQFAILEERQRLARELHDSVTQALYSVTLYADAGLLAYSRKQWDALEQNLRDARALAREAMYDMRLMVFELRPLMLEKEGLVAALRSRLIAVEARAGLKTEVLVENERRLQIGIEEQIYRIVQEGLNNVVKHARAGMVQIQIFYEKDTIRLVVIDDGLGFDPDTIELSGGVGLQGIQERVQQLNGYLEIHSALGNGTRLTITIPLSAADSIQPVEGARR